MATAGQNPNSLPAGYADLTALAVHTGMTDELRDAILALMKVPLSSPVHSISTITPAEIEEVCANTQLSGSGLAIGEKTVTRLFFREAVRTCASASPGSPVSSSMPSGYGPPSPIG